MQPWPELPLLLATDLAAAAAEAALLALGRVGARAGGTVAALLTPVNDPNAPGYDAEKNLSKTHPTLPPSPDAFRLAELERLREMGQLTDAEEAEMIALLAKVKGIRVQSLADLHVSGPLRGNDVAMPGFHNIQLQYTKRSKADLKALRDKFDTSARKEFLQKLSKDPQAVKKLKAAGLTDDEIRRVANGKVPNLEWQVHHKLPLDDGGDNSFDNLVLIKNDPYHKAITNLQNASTRGMQPGDTRVLAWPVCSGSIYPN